MGWTLQKQKIRRDGKRELYKKDLQNPDNHDGVITHLELDILECKVKWALGSITMNKASGGDEIPVELFQILKDDTLFPYTTLFLRKESDSMSNFTSQWRTDIENSIMDTGDAS